MPETRGKSMISVRCVIVGLTETDYLLISETIVLNE